MGQRIPMVDYLELDGDGPRLVANECRNCGALFFDRRVACAHCGQREFGTRPLATTGTLRAFTIVHRAAPNVPTPYVSGIFDLDGGGVVKATLRNVEADPDVVRLGMPVRLTTFVAGTDGVGTEAVAFAFEPAEPAEAAAT